MNKNIMQRLDKKFKSLQSKKESMIKNGLTDLFNDSKHMISMTESVACLNKAISNNQKLYIISDSDTDGIGTYYVFHKFFKDIMMYDNFVQRITNRQEGYGLLKRHIDEAIELDCKLIITADHGISSIEAVNYANSKGIDVIITDHHQTLKSDTYAPIARAIDNFKKIELHYSDNSYELALYTIDYIKSDRGKNYFNVEIVEKAKNSPNTPNIHNNVIIDLDEVNPFNNTDVILHETIPNTKYIINPAINTNNSKFPYEFMTGTVVLNLFLYNNVIKFDINTFMMEMYLTTISDMMNVDKNNIHNYTIVLLGQQLFKDDELMYEFVESREYVMTFMDDKGIDMITVDDIGFALSPIINSANRAGDANLAGQFIIEDDPRKSLILYKKLNEYNNKRKETQFVLTSRVYALHAHKFDNNDTMCVLPLTNAIKSKYDKAVLGLVANTFMNNFSIPAMALAYNPKRNTYVGSGRSPYGIIDILMGKDYDKFLTHVGGHAHAFGIGVKGEFIDEFIQKLRNDKRLQKLRDEYRRNPVNAYLVETDDLTGDNLKLLGDYLAKCEPFMRGFERPTFGLKDVTITSLKKFGGSSRDKFRNLTIDNKLSVTMFDVPFNLRHIKPRTKVDLHLLTVKVTEYRGNYQLLSDKCYIK